MKIAIITEGGKGIGFGHITRCLSLYNEFIRRNIEVLFICNNDKSVIDRLKGININVYKLGADSIGEISDFTMGFDCAIVDSYLLNKNDLIKIKECARVLACIDDNNRLDYPADIIVNGAIYSKDLDYSGRKDVIYLLGSSFMPIRSEFSVTIKKYIRKKIRKILITFGGDDSKNMTPVVRDYILSRYPDMDMDIIIGRSFRSIGSFKNNKNKNIRYHYDINANDMIRLMQSNDIAISAGGQTLYELARTGMPTIGICVAQNQVNNLKGWSKLGFLEYCGWHNDPGLLQRLEKSLANIESKKIREKMKKIGQDNIDGLGVERIVNRILEVKK